LRRDRQGKGNVGCGTGEVAWDRGLIERCTGGSQLRQHIKVPRLAYQEVITFIPL
jgi:hypothetical protein